MPRTFLLDMDGTLMCRLNKDVLNQTYCQVIAYADLPQLLSDHPFLSQIRPDDTIMSGSYRTDLGLDLTGIMDFANLNIMGPSLTDVLNQISQDTQAKIDNFLFGDIGIVKEEKLHQTILHEEFTAAGTTWNEMDTFYNTYRKLDTQNLHWFNQGYNTVISRAISDYDKIVAMYVWLQHIAQKNNVSTETPHEVMFYDDHEQILQELIAFYTTHTDWIPEGITLKIHRYAPSKTPANHAENTIQPTLLKEIKGTGKPHPQFVKVARYISSYLLLNVNGYKRLDKNAFATNKKQLSNLGINASNANSCTQKVIVRKRELESSEPIGSNGSSSSSAIRINISGCSSHFIVTKRLKNGTV